MSFDPTLIAQARTAIHDAGFGTKTAKAAQWAQLLNITPQTLYRIINNGNGKRARKGNPVKAEYQEWSKIIFRIKKTPPEEAGEISTEDALAIAVKSAQVPDSALNVPVATYNRIGKENGWTSTSIRANRFQAERPNQAHHFDASTSKFFYIAKKIDSGQAGMTDYLLKIHRPAKHYKNKPVPVDALRPWIYGLVDDNSGRLTARYVAAQGENSADSMSFLSWAWAEFGLPEQLLADQGMLKKALPSRDLIERLGVELPEMMPYQKRGHGKIERPWRTTWLKFELPFFAAAEWDKFEISLSELNQQLQNYISDKYNQLSHRFEKTITRMDAWKRINLHGGIVKIPENALATVARRAKRKVGIDGILQYEGVPYEVKGLQDAEVWVFEGVFNEQLVVQEIETGKKFEVVDFKPLSLGEYRSHPATPHEQLVQESATLALTGTTLYGEKKPQNEKIISMPIKTKEEREIEDPFDVDTYPSIREAMNDFMSYLPGVFLNPNDREVIEREIEANGLSKSFVQNFALEVRAQMSRRIAM